MRWIARNAALLSIAALASCATKLPNDLPPLADMVEPLDLFDEPGDEAARRDLPLGGFTGAYVGDARDSLDALLGDKNAGVEIVRIVENSPADIAGLRVGDLLLEARSGDGAARALGYPSQWREVELQALPGAKLAVVFDRANRKGQCTLEVVKRVHPTERGAVERLREEERVGVVFRTATEVEARPAGLGPGGGVVVVGLSKRSPWRNAGIAYGDLIVEIDGNRIAHPEVVLEAIRNAGDVMAVKVMRKGNSHDVKTAMSRRASELREFFVPVLFSYESHRGKTEWQLLLGLLGYERTAAAWRVQLLWLIQFGGGDADRLIETDK